GIRDFHVTGVQSVLFRSCVQTGREFVELAAVDIGQIVAAHAVLGEGQERLGNQLRAEKRATDANIDYVGDGLLAVAAPQVAVDRSEERRVGKEVRSWWGR